MRIFCSGDVMVDAIMVDPSFDVRRRGHESHLAPALLVEGGLVADTIVRSHA